MSEQTKALSLRLKPAPGSSFQKIIERLTAGRVCQVAIVGFDVWVHHTNSHEELRRAIGAEWSDLSGEGNFSIIGFLPSRPLVVRWKSDTDVPLSQTADSLIATQFQGVPQ